MDFSIQVLQRNIAKTLSTIRREQGIRQEQLCYGICYKATYSRYEAGERMPDRLTLNALMQRLGKDAGKISSAVSSEEYAYFMWKRSALQAAEEKDMEELEELLHRPEAALSPKNGNEKLQQQFLSQMQALIRDAEEQKGDTGEPMQKSSIAFLQDAIETTIPGFQPEQIDRYLISIYELTLLIDLAEQQVKAGMTGESLRLLESVIRYTDTRFQDIDAKVKVIPRAVRLLAPILMEEKEYMECMMLCRKAIEMLCKVSTLYGLASLMETYIEASRHGFPTDLTVRYEKQLQALRELYREYGSDLYQAENASLYYQNQEIYLIQELIRYTRISRDMSQEKLSEDICTPENLSRIESGKHTPNARIFRALMEKLGTELDYYTMELDTANFLLLEKKREMDRAQSLHEYERARILLEEIKEGLDAEGSLNQYRNQHIIATEESLLSCYEGERDADFMMRHCQEFFHCKEEDWLQEAFWKQFFTGYKFDLLNALAIHYATKRKERDKAIFLWENILKWLKESRVSLVDRYSASMTAISNLSAHYGEAGRLDDCIRICDEGIRLSLASGRGVRLGQLLVNQAEALAEQGKTEKETCRKYVRQAYYLNDLMGPEKVTKYTDQYYRKTYDPDMKWY